MSTQSEEDEWLMRFLCFIITIAIFWLIYIPMLWFGLLKYLKYKDELFIQKRYPLITKIQIYSSLLLVAIEYTINIIYRTIIEDEKSTLYTVLWNLSLLLQPLMVYAAFYCLFWRFWMNYFDTNLVSQVSSKLWKMRINSNVENMEKENWFEHNKQKYGNHVVCGRKIFIIYLFSVIIASTCWFMSSYIGYTTAAIIDFFVFRYVK